MFHQASHAVTPYHTHENRDHNSSKAVDLHKHVNKKVGAKNITAENKKDDMPNYCCKHTEKKILASSITYKDSAILSAIGGNRIR